MDNFETRLSASMKAAAEKRQDFHPDAIPPYRFNKHRASLAALVAAVVVGAVITGTTVLFDRDDTTPAVVDTPTSKQIVLKGKWRVVDLRDEDGESLLRSDNVWLIFGKGQVGGYTECNGFGSVRYKQSGPGGRDLMIPSFARRAQKARAGCVRTPISTRLEAVRHVSESDGVLRLHDNTGTSIVTLIRIGEPVNLVGEWKVTAFYGESGRAVSLADLGGKFRLTFYPHKVGATTKMTATTGCNRVSNSYEQSGADGRNLAWSDIGATSRKFCRNGEPPLLDRLVSVRHVTEENGKLHLQDENWATIATLERVGESPAIRTRYQPCDGDSIRVTSRLGAAAGSKGVRITVTRTSDEPCLLPFHPQRVQFFYRDALLRLKTNRERGYPDSSVVLATGFPATSVLQWSNWCAPAVTNDRITLRVGTRTFDVPGFGTSPNCGANGGAAGGESLDIRSPILIGFYTTDGERVVSTSGGALTRR